MRRLAGMCGFLAMSVQAGTWSFEGKPVNEMTECEQTAYYYSQHLISVSPDLTQKLTDLVRENFKEILQDIRNAEAENKLTPETLSRSSDVNLSLMMIETYARKYDLTDILEEMRLLEAQYPALFEDVCT